jgi:hypothetical protein
LLKNVADSRANFDGKGGGGGGSGRPRSGPYRFSPFFSVSVSLGIFLCPVRSVNISLKP